MSPLGKPYQELIMEGTIINSNDSPSHHFARIDADMVGMDLADILIAKLKKYPDIYVDENMDIRALQGLLAEKRKEEAEKGNVDIMKKVLNSHGIKFHHKLGAERLSKLIDKHELIDELKEATRTGA